MAKKQLNDDFWQEEEAEELASEAQPENQIEAQTEDVPAPSAVKKISKKAIIIPVLVLFALLITLTTVLLLTSSPESENFYNVSVDSFKYDVIDGKATVKGVAYAGATKINIPAEITYNDKVYPVTSIGEYAFEDCSSLTSIIIPEGVTSIGDSAFKNCSNLASIVIPEGVTSIGYGAFYNCSKLTNIVIPESVTFIDDYAFYYCKSLTSIVIPKSVTSIGDSAFYGCNKLVEVYNKSSLNITKGSDSYGYVGYYALNVYTPGNGESKMFTTSDGFVFYDDGAKRYLVGYTGTETDITLPSTCNGYGYEIYKFAFYSCENLTSMVIPESVTYIGWYAFRYCSGLTSIVIPEGMTSIGDYAFQYCHKLVEICNKSSLDITKGSDSYGLVGYYALNVYTPINGESKMFTTSDGFVFYDDGAKRCLLGYTGTETDITLPSTCNGYGYEIYEYAFYYCSSLTSIVIPEGVTSIGKNTFRYCSKLTSIVIPEGVTSIGNNAFHHCVSLASIVIPESVTSIGEYAFYQCTNLTSIVIPEGVTSIGDRVFEYCYNLTSIVIPEGVTSIGDYAFSTCKSLTSIVIPEGVTTIGYYAFAYCTNLTIYCEAASQPSGWDSDWNYNNRPVVWGYFDENACLSKIFTFKGYSFDGKGGFAVGFAIDYDALAKYEAKTGKTVQIGVVFAGYDNLGGSQPLDEMGEAIVLQVGKVVKADITEYGYKYYDFMLTGFDGSIMDIGLVIAGYIFDGEAAKYVQSNGMSDTVYGITYNEALNG